MLSTKIDAGAVLWAEGATPRYKSGKYSSSHPTCQGVAWGTGLICPSPRGLVCAVEEATSDPGADGLSFREASVWQFVHQHCAHRSRPSVPKKLAKPRAEVVVAPSSEGQYSDDDLWR